MIFARFHCDPPNPDEYSINESLEMNVNFEDGDAVKRCNSVAAEMKLAAALALELGKAAAAESASKSKSAWRPYLRIMPTMDDMRQSQASLADGDVQEFMQMLPSVRSQRLAYLTKQRVSRGCFEGWQQAAESPVAAISWEDMVYSYILMFTRTFDLRAPGGYHWTKTTFVPFLDMLNTVPSYKANVRWDWQDGALQVKTLRNVTAGDELAQAYCTNCDNEHVLGQWGVYFEDSEYGLSGFGKPNCSDGLRREDEKTQAVGKLRQEAEAVLDLRSMRQALKEGWSAPRCKANSGHQGVLRCLLGRLAWERCASDWGYEGWNKTKLKDPEARQKAASPHYNIALSLKNLGDIKDAERSYKDSLRLKPNQPDVQYSFGVFLHTQNKTKEARRALQAAVKLAPAHQDSHVALAHLLGSVGEYEEGKKHIDIATRLKKANAHAADR
eukprot:TRINITY_DN10199_c0_g2_i1.p1 TRINITY_DN10199_c0_g2~~TRINITY_DN10199_c0_g2_i1.p1  ORF type:complete len:442 (-),score=100.49 TRINITY_DN10199_c0_g2_i1:76-1401(-)